jgi:hypothetical protein
MVDASDFRKGSRAIYFGEVGAAVGEITAEPDGPRPEDRMTIDLDLPGDDVVLTRIRVPVGRCILVERAPENAEKTS